MVARHKPNAQYNAKIYFILWIITVTFIKRETFISHLLPLRVKQIVRHFSSIHAIQRALRNRLESLHRFVNVHRNPLRELHVIFAQHLIQYDCKLQLPDVPDKNAHTAYEKRPKPNKLKKKKKIWKKIERKTNKTEKWKKKVCKQCLVIMTPYLENKQSDDIFF